MSGLRFSWDEKKVAANLSKHGVSLDETLTAFADLLACIFGD